MIYKKRITAIIICFIFLLSACGNSSNTDKLIDAPSDTIVDNEDLTPEIVADNNNSQPDVSQVDGSIEEVENYLENMTISKEERVIELNLPEDAILIADSEDAIIYRVYNTVDGLIETDFYRYDKGNQTSELIYKVKSTFGVVFSEYFNGRLLVAEWDETSRITLVEMEKVETLYEYNSSDYPIVKRIGDYLLLEDNIIGGENITQKLISIDISTNKIENVDEQIYAQKETGAYISGTRINHFDGFDNEAIIEYITYDEKPEENSKNVFWKNYDFESKELKELCLNIEKATYQITGTQDIIIYSHYPERTENSDIGHMLINQNGSYQEYVIPQIHASAEVNKAELLDNRYVYLCLNNFDMYVIDLNNLHMDKFGNSNTVNNVLIKCSDDTLAGIVGGNYISYLFP